jgi:hypothetical protein
VPARELPGADEPAYRKEMVKVRRCRVGLHRYVRRHDTPDPNLQVCVQCGKHRIADAIWGVLGRRGSG